jgi:hypothetical protein
MIGNFGILESSATQRYQENAPIQQFFFFFIVASTVHVQNGHAMRGQLKLTICSSVVYGLMGVAMLFDVV